MKKTEYDLVKVIPSNRQMQLQQKEFYAFVHFTINTFTGKEWGDGTESPEIFAPENLDAKQWTKAIKAAGMKGLLLTCKHHDGFCLWPSQYTEHTVKNSPWKDGKGDLVAEVAKACEEEGLAFGVYLSPWDRNHTSYGSGEAYNDYFCNQLMELLTAYGPIFSVWFDGACGEGNTESTKGKKQIYDWNRYYDVIRKYQPDACIHICGPDIRWCGNEVGKGREKEWSVVSKRLLDCEKIQEESQTEDNDAFREKEIKSQDMDLGSRDRIIDEVELIWYPSEVDVSIRPGWFYHTEEDVKVKTMEKLIQIYCQSVGNNATFLLNIPPNTQGLFAEADLKRLDEFGNWLKTTFANNLLENATLQSDSFEIGHDVESIRCDDYTTYFKTENEVCAVDILLTWEQEQTPSYLVLKENVWLSQRIEAFEIEVLIEGAWVCIYKGNTVGYKKIVPLNNRKTSQIRIKIEEARVAPTLAFVGVY